MRKMSDLVREQNPLMLPASTILAQTRPVVTFVL
jgi:hypothetical protein